MKEKYVSLTRAAEVLRLTRDQVNQYLVTGQLLSSIVYHRPTDFRERREVNLEDGSIAVHTKTSRTMLRFVSTGHQFAPLMYLHPDDATRVLLNKVSNREMLISRLFYDRNLSPKRGIGLAGDSAIAITPDDLVISSEELGRFAKHARIRIKASTASSAGLPQKSWYDQPIGRTGLAILGAVIAGVIIMRLRGDI